MAVRCPGCGRLSRDESVCEWCRAEIPPEVRRPAMIEAGGAGEEAAAVASPSSHSVSRGEATGSEESNGAAAEVAEEGAAVEGESAPHDDHETPDLLAVPGEIERQPDNDTLVILLLIWLQLALTLYLGRLSSWWSVTGILWLAVGYGVKERLSWSLALPLVLFALDIALLLFGIGPRERSGFPAFAPLDFFLYTLRLVIWALIWRLRDELE